MNVGSLFSGIGGLDLGLERAGMSVKWQCEIDPYCRAVLRKHWPDVPCYEDIRTLRGAEQVDLICGGFPCQPVSLAGRGKAQADERWLWPEFERVVGELRPRYVLVENVPGLATRGLGIVVGSLAALGYDAEWDIVSAASIGAPHLRERIFLVAYSNGERSVERRLSEGQGEHCLSDTTRSNGKRSSASRQGHSGRKGLADSNGAGLTHVEGCPRPPKPPWRQIFGPNDPRHRTHTWPAEPDVGRVAYGLSDQSHRLRALGNAVVPQVAEYVGRLIMKREEQLVA